MIVYKAIKSQFLTDASNGIEEIVRENVSSRLGIKVQIGSSEYNSWKNSLGNAMFHVMNTAEIPDDSVVAVEYCIPRTKKRIDFIISGQNKDKHDSIVIIELKQWDSANKTSKDGIVSTRFQHGSSETNHPSYQAWSYASLLQNFNEVVYTENTQLKPCAYLHNLKETQGVNDEFYTDYLQRAPAFYDGQKELVQEFVKNSIVFGESNNTLERIDSGNVRPSKELADNIASMIKGNQEFVLIDDQKIVYENALALAKKTDNNQKNVFIVEGGPGTGKSVIAINLLSSIIKLGLNACYVTKNAAPRAVFESKLSGTFKKTRITELFQPSGSFINMEANGMDVLIIDEAHRLNAKSGIYKNLGENQVKELINAAKTTIFFIDEDQMVTWHDIGKVAEIEKWAKFFNANISYAELESQFRCNGSDGYLSWLDNTLQIKETANMSLSGLNYDFKVFSSPNKLHEAIIGKNSTNNKSRLVAGYCWKWVSKKNKLLNDIIIPEFNFARQWNLVEDGNTYIIAKDSVQQIGCIHTCQGLELDYVGVIIGNDFIVRNGVVITDPNNRASSDKSLHGLQKSLKIDKTQAELRADLIIKNTYKVLMTRGLKGCYVFCTDEETADYFRKKTKSPFEN